MVGSERSWQRCAESTRLQWREKEWRRSSFRWASRVSPIDAANQVRAGDISSAIEDDDYTISTPFPGGHWEKIWKPADPLRMFEQGDAGGKKVAFKNSRHQGCRGAETLLSLCFFSRRRGKCHYLFACGSFVSRFAAAFILKKYAEDLEAWCWRGRQVHAEDKYEMRARNICWGRKLMENFLRRVTKISS